SSEQGVGEKGADEGECLPQEVASSSVVPPKGWTAWPMGADVVRRGDGDIWTDGDDAWTLRMQPDWRPSAELEECLMAHMLKTAKEKFESREWDEQPGAGYRSRRKRTCKREHMEENTDNERYSSDTDRDSHIELRPVVEADDEKS